MPTPPSSEVRSAQNSAWALYVLAALCAGALALLLFVAVDSYRERFLWITMPAVAFSMLPVGVLVWLAAEIRGHRSTHSDASTS